MCEYVSACVSTPSFNTTPCNNNLHITASRKSIVMLWNIYSKAKTSVIEYKARGEVFDIGRGVMGHYLPSAIHPGY